jgi:hypothetical protein
MVTELPDTDPETGPELKQGSAFVTETLPVSVEPEWLNVLVIAPPPARDDLYVPRHCPLRSRLRVILNWQVAPPPGQVPVITSICSSADPLR